ncbi:PQQ-binding-like beta-propeller repeat protein [Undibacterium sp. TJN19]|uniref:outer membrane protein assembly factor BamB family protein n=1 Tax=Undibacterium sp. TJN19 TaxID=3413055 RepID=UPI003BEF933C
MKTLLLASLLSLLSACGGGGGGSSASVAVGGGTSTSADSGGTGGSQTDTSSANGVAMTLLPASLKASQAQGDSLVLTFEARTNQIFDGKNVSFGVFDSNSIGNSISQVGLSLSNYQVQIVTSSKLAVGTYSGVFEVRVCKDFAVVCAQPLPGSPWKLPYTLEVKAPNLKALPPLPGGADWTSVQGNREHNGYVPVTLNVNNFSPRFYLSLSESNKQFTLMSHQNGAGYLGSKSFAGGDMLAIDENTGKLKWTYSMPGDTSLTQPAAENDQVYFVMTRSGSSSIFRISQQSGQVPTTQPLGTQTVTGGTPTADAQSVHGSDGAGTYLYSFSPTSISFNWRYLGSDTGVRTGTWSPAIDNDFAYAYTVINDRGDASLFIFDRKTGRLVKSIAGNAASVQGNISSTYPALCNSKNVLTSLAGTTLSMFDLAQSTVKWKATGSFQSPPVCSPLAVYVLNESGIEVRSVDNGNVLWTWPLPAANHTVYAYKTGMSKSLLLTNNLLFVSTERNVYAIDVNTHQSVWAYPKEGQLSMSRNGVLYLQSFFNSGGDITAINLQ